MNVTKKIADLIGHNRYLIISLVLIGAMLVWGVGCASKTTSPTTGGEVSRAGLNADYDAWYAVWQAEASAMDAQFGAAVADLDQQDALKVAVADFGMQIASTTPLAPYLVGAGGLLAALGIGVDNRRKDAKIVERDTIIAAAGLKPSA